MIRARRIIKGIVLLLVLMVGCDILCCKNDLNAKVEELRTLKQVLDDEYRRCNLL
jgi:hypothetical protein